MYYWIPTASLELWNEEKLDTRLAEWKTWCLKKHLYLKFFFKVSTLQLFQCYSFVLRARNAWGQPKTHVHQWLSLQGCVEMDEDATWVYARKLSKLKTKASAVTWSGKMRRELAMSRRKSPVGLIPDWVIEKMSKSFGLELPTLLRPTITGLLDPASNSSSEPNIPAEIVFTEDDNGLDQFNSWLNWFILLNPPFSKV
jgi:hypothetical protein